MGFPGDSDGKDFACDAEDLSSILGSGRSPGEGNTNPFQHGERSLVGYRQRSLVGYSPWGHKELDTTERLTLSLA